MIKKLKNYIFLNILSIMGYINLVALLIAKLILFPYAYRIDETLGSDPIAYFLMGGKIIHIFQIFIVIEIILIILTILEFFLRKKFPLSLKIKIPSWIKQTHSILFWIGIILVPTPFYVLFFHVLALI